MRGDSDSSNTLSLQANNYSIADMSGMKAENYSNNTNIQQQLQNIDNNNNNNENTNNNIQQIPITNGQIRHNSVTNSGNSNLDLENSFYDDDDEDNPFEII